MKRIQYLLLAMLSLLMFSCNEKAKTIKPVSSKIRGPFAECFEVVVRDYRIIGNQVNIEFLRVKEGVVEPNILAEFLDENGNVIATSNVVDNNEELRFLFANKVGESSTLTFLIDNCNPTQLRFNSSVQNKENEEVSELEEEVTSVEFVEEVNEIPVVKEEAIEVETGKEEVVEIGVQKEEQKLSQSVKSTNSRDWDKVLDDFESYVDQYISFSKKASSGDLTALAEYASLLEKTEKLEKDLNAAQNEMSKAQMKRYLKIMEKMTNAAIDMYDE